MQDLPPVQPIDFVLSEDSTLEQIGSVHSIVEQIGRCVYAYTVYRPLSMRKTLVYLRITAAVLVGKYLLCAMIV